MADGQRKKGVEDMAAELDIMWRDAYRVMSDPNVFDRAYTNIPDVDPSDPDLSDLFAWGEAVSREARVSDDMYKRIVGLAKEHAAKDRYR